MSLHGKANLWSVSCNSVFIYSAEILLHQMLFQALGLHIEQDRRSVFTLFLNSGFLGNAAELQDPDPDGAVELSRWKWQQEVKWVVLVGKGQEGLDWTCERT